MTVESEPKVYVMLKNERIEPQFPKIAMENMRKV